MTGHGGGGAAPPAAPPPATPARLPPPSGARAPTTGRTPRRRPVPSARPGPWRRRPASLAPTSAGPTPARPPSWCSCSSSCRSCWSSCPRRTGGSSPATAGSTCRRTSPRRPAPAALAGHRVHRQVHRHHHGSCSHRPGPRPGARAGVQPVEEPRAHRDPRAQCTGPRLGVTAVLRPVLAAERPHQPGPHQPRGRRRAGVVPRHARPGAVVHRVPHRLALRRLLHAAADGRAAGHPG